MSFSENLGIDSDDLTEIKKCIATTFIVQQQSSLPEKIIFDAFSFYFGSETFAEYNHLMRREIEAFTGNGIKGSEWRERTISLLENHEFQTEYCQSLLNKTKEENLQSIMRKHGEKHWVQHPANENHKQRNLVPGGRITYIFMAHINLIYRVNLHNQLIRTNRLKIKEFGLLKSNII